MSAAGDSAGARGGNFHINMQHTLIDPSPGSHSGRVVWRLRALKPKSWAASFTVTGRDS